MSFPGNNFRPQFSAWLKYLPRGGKVTEYKAPELQVNCKYKSAPINIFIRNRIYRKIVKNCQKLSKIVKNCQKSNK